MKEFIELCGIRLQPKEEKIFISGPMTGYPDFNFPLFNAVSKILIQKGFDVVNPVNICRKYKKEKVLSDKEIFNAMIEEQQKEERKCTVLLLLPKWENSAGVRLELQTAIELKMKILQWRN